MSSNPSSYALEKTETLLRTKIEESGDWIIWKVRRFRVQGYRVLKSLDI